MIPVLPANISTITSIFPTVDRFGVSPRESPTVPRAEQTSNNKSVSVKIPILIDFDSLQSKNIYKIPKKQRAFTKTETAFPIESSEISR